VHLGGRGGGVLPADEEDEGDAAAAAGFTVLEDRDARDAAESGEEEMEIGVGEREVQVGDVDGGFGRREATRAPARTPTPGLAAASR